MYLIFEWFFYAGLLLIGSAIAIGLWRCIRGRFTQLGLPAALFLAGVLTIAAPAWYSRYRSVDLGPRSVLVEGERHITLTGWDQSDYSILRQFPETTILQMANPDVDDATLDHIVAMANLRELDLNDSSVTNSGVAKLSPLTGLEVIRLRGATITDEVFGETLNKLTKLRALDLRETTVSNQAIDKWKSAQPGRRVFK